MYEVLFTNEWAQTNKNYVRLVVSDLERALAIASMLGKISTPEVQFGEIKVEPFKLEDHEK